jgi:hypothetical protein
VPILSARKAARQNEKQSDTIACDVEASIAILAAKIVRAEPYQVQYAAMRSYDIAEETDNRTGFDTQNVVLVEVDKIDNSKAAYPNYFSDVSLFET